MTTNSDDTARLSKVDATTPVEILHRWQEDDGATQNVSYLVGGDVQVRVKISYGPEGYRAEMWPDDRQLCETPQVMYQALMRALVFDQGEPALVFINSTGGVNDIETSGAVEVLEIDWDQAEEARRVPEIPDRFLEAFPYLRGNVEATRRDIERLREDDRRAEEASVRAELLQQIAEQVSTENLRSFLRVSSGTLVIEKGQIKETGVYSPALPTEASHAGK